LRSDSPWTIGLAVPLSIAAISVAVGSHPAEQFDEGGVGTWGSCLLLLASAAAAFDTWRARRDPHRFATSALLWLVITFGFAYLALDDAFSWHEKLDRFIHRKVLRMEATETSKRMDDWIIGIYGLLALGVLYRFRDETFRVPGLLRVFALAMALLAFQVVLDSLNHPAFIRSFDEKARRRQARTWLPVAEETVKLVAEGVFLVGFLRAREYAQREPTRRPGSG
jgi:hypothetical protein